MELLKYIFFRRHKETFLDVEWLKEILRSIAIEKLSLMWNG